MIKTHPVIGEIMVPYFRQLLPIMNLFKNKNINLGDKIDFSQRKNDNIGDLIQETLEIFETYGGEVNKIKPHNFSLIKCLGCLHQYQIYNTYL